MAGTNFPGHYEEARVPTNGHFSNAMASLYIAPEASLYVHILKWRPLACALSKDEVSFFKTLLIMIIIRSSS